MKGMLIKTLFECIFIPESVGFSIHDTHYFADENGNRLEEPGDLSEAYDAGDIIVSTEQGVDYLFRGVFDAYQWCAAINKHIADHATQDTIVIDLNKLQKNTSGEYAEFEAKELQISHGS